MTFINRFIAYLFWLGIAAVSLALIWACAIALYFWPGLSEEVAQLQNVEALLEEQLEMPMRIYTAEGRLIAEFGEHRRTRIHYEAIPRTYIDALLAAEDADFYRHMGVDIRGLLRATVQLMETGSIQSGGSTISMQVARNYLLTRDRTFARKIREILLSLRMEQLLTKEQILELYVNKIYLGNRAYGIVAAAEVYYGRSLDELNLAQTAMIAGLPKAPSAYNPLANPQRALIRRNWILTRMYHLGRLDDASYEQAIRAPISARFHPPERDVHAPYVAEAARIEALALFGDRAYTRGLHVYTSVRAEHQIAANQAIEQGILDYDQRRGWRGVERRAIPLLDEHQQPLAADAQAELEATESDLAAIQQALADPRAQILLEQLGLDVSAWLRILDTTRVIGGLVPAIVLDAEPEHLRVLARGGEIIELPRAAFRWAGRYHSPFWKEPNALPGHRLASRGDLVRLRPNTDPQLPWLLAQIPRLEAALIAHDTHTGQITAMVGGLDFNHSRFNRAQQAERQAGSVFKPLIYLAALERGYTPATIINDAPVVFEDRQLEDTWRPQNSSGTFYGPTPLREGLARSRNLISIRVLEYVGLRPALDYLARFGFNTQTLPENLSLALGSAVVTPEQINQAYAAVANGGFAVHSHLITRIENNDGEVLYQALAPRACRNCSHEQRSLRLQGVDYPLAQRIADERAVYTMHSILRDVIDDGTGRRAQVLNRADLRGKTGTTNDLRDTWFAGFNRDLAVTVWAGFDQPASTGEYGANLALPIWIHFMRTALAGEGERFLERPNGLVTVRIDPKTGERARPDQPGSIFEIFYQERAPAPLTPNRQQPNAPETPPEAIFTAPEALF